MPGIVLQAVWEPPPKGLMRLPCSTAREMPRQNLMLFSKRGPFEHQALAY